MDINTAYLSFHGLETAVLSVVLDRGDIQRLYVQSVRNSVPSVSLTVVIIPSKHRIPPPPYLNFFYTDFSIQEHIHIDCKTK